MNLVVITAFIAVCGAAKLDRTYLPPASADSAGGSPGSLQAPGTRSSEQGIQNSLPSGSYTNNFGGVVVDAAAPGTRSSDGLSGLGGPRPSYGSSDSKVGDAAFRGSVAGFRGTPTFGASGQIGTHGENAVVESHNHAGNGFSSNVPIDTHAAHGFANGQVNSQIGSHSGKFSSNSQETNGQFSSNSQSFQSFENKSERPQAAKDRNSNILALSNDVNTDSYSYGFETDNGITVGENGVAANGIQAEGGYSYQGDDGQVYKVTYTADEGGYRPQGAHLPTPPPIPEEILKSLEQNAKEEAAGLVDDGSYDAQKYNTDGDYTHDNGGNIQYNGAQLSQFEKRPESDATAVGTFNQNNQVFGKPGSTQFETGSNANNAHLAFNGQSSQANGNTGSGHFGAASNAQNSFNGQLNGKPGQFGISSSQSSFNGQSTQVSKQPGSAQFGSGSQNTQSTFGHSSHGSQFDSQNSFNGQLNGKPEHFGISSSQPSFNGQSTQVSNQPGSAQFGSGSQNTQSTFGHSSHGSQFNSNTALNGNSGSQSSHSSQPLNGYHGSSVTGHSGTQLSSLSGQAQGSFGSQTQSQVGHQGSASSQLQNLTPDSDSQQNQQQQTFDQGAGNSAVNHHSTHPQFGSSFKPQGSEAFSGASLNQDQDTQDFGKPSPQTFSGQNFNRPSSGGNFNYNKPNIGQDQMKYGSATVNGFNRFPQPSGQFGGQNEYLPPLNSNGQSQPNKPEFSTSGLTSSIDTSKLNSNGQKQELKDKIPDFEGLNRPRPGFASASASTSFGQPTFQPQPAKPLNAFDTQTQSKPNQFSQQQTTRFPQQTSQLSSPSQSNSDSQQSGSLAQSFSDFVSKPTTVPDTELTTPIEPNETPTSQGSQFSSQTTSSSFGFKPASSSQTQAQFGLQGNSAIVQQPTSHTSSSSFPTSSFNSNSHFGTASTQSAFQSSGKGPENSKEKLQFAQNSFGQTQQNQGFDDSYYYNQPSKAFGTPSVHPQGSRFPSSPSYQSNGVTSQNQFFNQQSFQSSPKFPGSPSLAPTRPTSATQFAQTQGYNGITQAAISPFPSASPTSSSQFSSTQNSQLGTKPSFNEHTNFGNQAPGAKPFFNQQSAFGNQGQITGNQEQPRFPPQPISGRLPPKPVGQIVGNQGNTFPQTVNDRPNRPKLSPKPSSSGSQTQNQFGQSESTPELSDVSAQQQTLTQQYPGTIYEYNKPAEVLPAPAQADSSSSQTFQTGVISESKPSFGQSQGNQLLNQQNSKPFSKISETGPKDTLNKPISSASHLGLHSQTTQQTGIQFGSQPEKPAYSQSSTNIQFGQTVQSGAQPDRLFGTSTFTQPGQTAQPTLSSNSQGSQTAQTFKPFGSASQGVNSPFGSKPQVGSQTTQFSQTTQSFGSYQSFQPQNDSRSQSQFSSHSSQNNLNNGYFYPGNPKPQFFEESKNQLGQNSQTGRPQPGPNQYQNIPSGNTQTTGFFNQQSSQLNSASIPQFGASSQGNQNTQTTFSQKAPNSPTQPQFGQSTASSQAFTSGQGTASASASSSPEGYTPFKTQLSQNKADQSEQGTQQFGAQNLKPFGSNTQENDAPNYKPFEASAQGSVEASKPLFNSPCCQVSKDSTPAQSTVRPSQTGFQGTQSFNSQSFAGKGEQFGGARQPPSFDDQTGYHY